MTTKFEVGKTYRSLYTGTEAKCVFITEHDTNPRVILQSYEGGQIYSLPTDPKQANWELKKELRKLYCAIYRPNTLHDVHYAGAWSSNEIRQDWIRYNSKDITILKIYEVTYEVTE